MFLLCNRDAFGYMPQIKSVLQCFLVPGVGQALKICDFSRVIFSFCYSEQALCGIVIMRLGLFLDAVEQNDFLLCYISFL